MSPFIMSSSLLIFSPFPDGLAAAGNAPRVFLKTSKKGLPFVSIIFCSLFSLLAVSLFIGKPVPLILKVYLFGSTWALIVDQAKSSGGLRT
jgi:L-asparagine transporter-like permease